MTDLSENLKKLMDRDAVDQATLARATKIPATTVGRLRSRETINPTLDTLRALARYFGVNISELVGEKPIPGLDPNFRGEFSIPYPHETETLNLIREISDQDASGNLTPATARALSSLLRSLVP